MPTLRELRIGSLVLPLNLETRGRGRNTRCKAVWRKGDGWTVSINMEEGCWYDPKTGEGGGPLCLVEVALGLCRRDALRWLEDRGLIDARDSRSPQRQAARRRQAAAEDLLSKLGPWRRMRARELEQAKCAALEAEDLVRLEHAARLLHRLQNGTPAEIVAAFREHQRHDPVAVQRLIAAAAEDEAHALRVAAWVANLLALADSGGKGAA